MHNMKLAGSFPGCYQRAGGTLQIGNSWTVVFESIPEGTYRVASGVASASTRRTKSGVMIFAGQESIVEFDGYRRRAKGMTLS